VRRLRPTASYALLGFGFQVNFFGGDSQGFREGFASFGAMLADFGTLADYLRVHVFDGEMLFVEKFARVAQEERLFASFHWDRCRAMRGESPRTSALPARVASAMAHVRPSGLSPDLVERLSNAADDELAPLGEASAGRKPCRANAHAFLLFFSFSARVEEKRCHSISRSGDY